MLAFREEVQVTPYQQYIMINSLPRSSLIACVQGGITHVAAFLIGRKIVKLTCVQCHHHHGPTVAVSRRIHGLM
jgi:hypothetical protein